MFHTIGRDVVVVKVVVKSEEVVFASWWSSRGVRFERTRFFDNYNKGGNRKTEEDGGAAFPNELTRLFSVDEDLKLAKMVRARELVAGESVCDDFCIGIVGMVCVYATYASEDVYDSSKEELETEAREMAEADVYEREVSALRER